MAKKDNIIKFPTPEEVTQKEALRMIELASDDCNGMARHLNDVIIEEIFNQSEYFVDADFYSEEHQASRDLYVITNLLNAMLLRHIDIPHELQKSLDKLYIKIKQLAQLPETEFEIDFGPDMGIEFVPDFDININDEEDKDDTDT
tara:strand:- start:2433 stop:2867 length:435 start_codon:yes stop_codon:yes gene_type:complete